MKLRLILLAYLKKKEEIKKKKEKGLLSRQKNHWL